MRRRFPQLGLALWVALSVGVVLPSHRHAAHRDHAPAGDDWTDDSHGLIDPSSSAHDAAADHESDPGHNDRDGHHGGGGGGHDESHCTICLFAAGLYSAVAAPAPLPALEPAASAPPAVPVRAPISGFDLPFHIRGPPPAA